MARVLRSVLAVVVVFILFVYVSGTLASLATKEALMLQRFEQYSDTSASGVPASEYPALAQAITHFLGGKQSTAQVQVAHNGIISDAFSEQELLHLQDIKNLVRISGLLRGIAIGIALILFGMYLLFRKSKRKLITDIHPVTALRTGSAAFLVILLVVVAWSIIDFDSLFVAFHKALFTNDLWLLNPETDLLLQLMPKPFFTAYALDLLKQNAFLLLILPLAVFGLRSQEKAKL